MKKHPKWALRIAAQINTNAEDVDEHRITWDEFSARNRAAWDSVSRGELSIIGSACHRRVMAVQAALKGLLP